MSAEKTYLGFRKWKFRLFFAFTGLIYFQVLHHIKAKLPKHLQQSVHMLRWNKQQTSFIFAYIIYKSLCNNFFSRIYSGDYKFSPGLHHTRVRHIKTLCLTTAPRRFRHMARTNLLSICTGILGTFDILQFEISSLMNWIFFLVWKQTGYFYQFKLYFFPSFWARVKYFDGPCSTIYSLFTIYRDIHYQLLVWWIHYTHCCESKKLKPGKFYLCSLWNNIFNYPNWDFGFC